jgi:hypothetical protein
VGEEGCAVSEFVRGKGEWADQLECERWEVEGREAKGRDVGGRERNGRKEARVGELEVRVIA